MAVQKGKPAKKYSQAGRVHDIIRLIEARHGITIEELAEEAGVTRRTIHRDLNAIQEAGYPLISEWSQGSKVYRFLTRFKDVPPISFTLQELMTLCFLRSQLDFLEGTPFHDDMEAIYRKVNSVLPPRYAAHMERIAGVSLPLLQGRRDYSRAGEPLKILRDALIYQHRVTIDYLVPGKDSPSSYLVDPYTLIFHRGGLYLLGYAHNRQALRTFALERVSRVVKENERFELPARFLSPRSSCGTPSALSRSRRFRSGCTFQRPLPMPSGIASGIPARKSKSWTTALLFYHSRRAEPWRLFPGSFPMAAMPRFSSRRNSGPK